MANVTDPLVRSLQGSDPQNLMEYITRQKIYDSRYWKEECFGLDTADVLEKAALSLQCIGGVMGANQKPSKFLCLTLKLLQLQPDSELIDDFIKQDEFKYVRALGCFYLRLTGRPHEIYERLESLYADRSKLKLRLQHTWELTYMDVVVHELLTESRFVGITLPRLPARETLQQEGYLEEGPRSTRLEEKLLKFGGLEAYLKHKAFVEKSPAAMQLWEERNGKPPVAEKETKTEDDEEGLVDQSEEKKRKSGSENSSPKKKKKRKEKDSKKYGSLFKKEKSSIKDDSGTLMDSNEKRAPIEGSEEYWNEERARLGLKPLNKK